MAALGGLVPVTRCSGKYRGVNFLEFRSLTSVAGVTSGAIVVLLGVSP